MNIINRNGRNGNLTSWGIEAREYFKKLYSLYSEFGETILLEQSDIKILLGYYRGKANNKIDALKDFLAREFRLMGYPQENKSNLKRQHIEFRGRNMLLDFKLDSENIDKNLFNEYQAQKTGKEAVVRLSEKNEAQKSPQIKEKAQVNIISLSDYINKELNKNIHIQKDDERRKQDLKGGWLDDEEI